MSSTERSEFVAGYTKLLTNAWSDDAFKKRLLADPVRVLEEVGLNVPAGTSVDIRDSQGQGDLDDQVKLWEQGLQSGKITLYVPDAPQVDTAELSESELEGVAGGADSYCCCCSPCCTCT